MADTIDGGNIVGRASLSLVVDHVVVQNAALVGGCAIRPCNKWHQPTSIRDRMVIRCQAFGIATSKTLLSAKGWCGGCA